MVSNKSLIYKYIYKKATHGISDVVQRNTFVVLLVSMKEQKGLLYKENQLHCHMILNIFQLMFIRNKHRVLMISPTLWQAGESGDKSSNLLFTLEKHKELKVLMLEKKRE